MSFHLIDTYDFHGKAENERFTAVGSLCRHHLKMKFSCRRLAELRMSVFCGRFELSKVPVIEGKTRGNRVCFELAQGSSCRKSTVL